MREPRRVKKPKLPKTILFVSAGWRERLCSPSWSRVQKPETPVTVLVVGYKRRVEPKTAVKIAIVHSFNITIVSL